MGTETEPQALVLSELREFDMDMDGVGGFLGYCLAVVLLLTTAVVGYEVLIVPPTTVSTIKNDDVSAVSKKPTQTRLAARSRVKQSRSATARQLKPSHARQGVQWPLTKSHLASGAAYAQEPVAPHR